MVLNGAKERDTDPLVSSTEAAPPTAESIVDAVAAATGSPPSELPPLYDAVDTGALDRFFDSTAHSTVTFRYLDFRVTAAGDGTVEVYPLDG